MQHTFMIAVRKWFLVKAMAWLYFFFGSVHFLYILSINVAVELKATYLLTPTCSC